MSLRELRMVFESLVRSSIGFLRRALSVEGVPVGISFETLDDLCRRHLEEPLGRVSYVPFFYSWEVAANFRMLLRRTPSIQGRSIAGWHSARNYRLLLQTRRGRRWSLFYKNHFSPDGVPASTEYLIYSNVHGALAEYLPDVHLCLENIPGRHYQFLLEDLHEYRKASTAEDLLRVAAMLPAIHDAISEWSLIVGQDRLFEIGAFREFLRKALESYAERTSDKDVSQVCGLWPGIYEEQVLKEFHELYRPIHWDFGPYNMLIHKKYPDRIKVIDWESVGLGLPHEDLVALLKRAPPAVEDQASTRYFEHNKRLSLTEHRRLYHWCQKESRLRYIAWMAMQHMESSPTGRLRVPAYIKRSMRPLLDSCQSLCG